MFWKKKKKVHPVKACVTISLTENALWQEKVAEFDTTKVMSALDAIEFLLKQMEYDILCQQVS